MRSGTKHLRIASAIQIILGLGGILLTYFLIGQGDISNSGISAEHALLTLILTYCGHAFQILAGLFGLLLSRKIPVHGNFRRAALYTPAYHIHPCKKRYRPYNNQCDFTGYTLLLSAQRI